MRCRFGPILQNRRVLFYGGQVWQGSTIFKPKAANFKKELEYLEKQRVGTLLYPKSKGPD